MGFMIAVEIAPTRTDNGCLPAPEELILCRIVREALTNIHRHSGSKHAVIRIGRNEKSVHVEVQDHGTGMSSDKIREIQAHGSAGVRGMPERLRQLGGEVSIAGARLTSGDTEPQA